VPRPPRLELAGVPLHVIQRGVNRAACFFGDVDRRFYLKCLGEAADRRRCAVHAYVLMTNHVHLLVTPAERGNVAAMLQDIGRKYVRTINTLHGRTGTLWEGRFKSSLIDSDSYLLTCQRYIELNPVRAGLVSHPGEYPWSSYSHYALGRLDRLISPHPIYDSLGRIDAERQAAYRSSMPQIVDEETLQKIRVAANSSCALGSPGFLLETTAKLGRKVAPPPRGRPPKDRTGTPAAPVVSGKLL
jgi:putative transposase